jgi:cytochrome c
MRIFAFCVLAFTLLIPVAAGAQEHARPDDAKALALKAVDYIRAAGADTAYKAFTEKVPGWIDRDLYVFVITRQGVVTAHGGIAMLVGRNLSDLKDVDGKPFIRDIVAVKDAGWVDYKWKNPQSSAVEAKTTYIVALGDTLVGVGTYK